MDLSIGAALERDHRHAGQPLNPSPAFVSCRTGVAAATEIVATTCFDSPGGSFSP